MTTLQEQYLTFLSSQIFIRANASEIEKETFLLRWLPQNKSKQNNSIFSELNGKFNNTLNEKAMNEYIKRVGEKLKTTFAEEMKADGFDLEKMEKQDRWPLTYQWLWGHKFPRDGWNFAQKIALPLPLPEKDKRDINLPRNPNQIVVDQPYSFPLIFQRDVYLLLLNLSSQGNKYLLAPSHFYADVPTTKLTANQSLLLASRDDHCPLSFGDPGEEYFLAFFTKNPVNVSWLNGEVDPNDVDLVTLNDARLKELLIKVAQDSCPEVFYRKLTVVNS